MSISPPTCICQTRAAVALHVKLGAAEVFAGCDARYDFLEVRDMTTFDFASLTSTYGEAVEGLAFDPYHRRLAGVGAGCLNVYDMDINSQLMLLQTTPKRPFIPQNVAFFDSGKNVVVCFLESHKTIAYKVDPWSIKWLHQLPTHIGNASLSIDKCTLIVSNLKDGIDTYFLPPCQLLRSFCHPISCNILLSVCSTQDGTLMLAGSDDGSPCLFDLRLGMLTQTLPHSHSGLVQAVTAYSHNGYYLLVTGASDICSTTNIKVWAESKFLGKPTHTSTTQESISILLSLAGHCSSVGFDCDADAHVTDSGTASSHLTNPHADIKMAVSKVVAASESVSVSKAVAHYIPLQD
ncbi:hypothetical protein Hypma_012338 [Hypsizygus marmoreus]|uniref:Uncharacterized protein n=1 Tax=Hypsizygus marmoreus TaxID=39966 RepID=A0A369KEG5_HYPMA|nr:hypothetical protein Hypma_012338 [Hypsizygus marmoreus]